MTSREPGKWYVFACLMILGLSLLASIESAAERAVTNNDILNPIDFEVFYLGGKVALQRGAISLYTPPADRSQGYTLLYKFADPATSWAKLARANGFSEMLQFTNPPFSAVIMAPLALLPWRWGYLIWQCVIIILTATSIFLTLKLLPSGARLETFAWMFGAVCFFFPFKSTLVFGQVNASILFVWTLGVYLLHRRTADGFGLVLRLGDGSEDCARGCCAAPRFAPSVAVAGRVRGGGDWLYRDFHLAIGLATNLTWLTADLPGHLSRGGKRLQPLACRARDVLCGPRYHANLMADTEWPVPYGLSSVRERMQPRDSGWASFTGAGENVETRRD